MSDESAKPRIVVTFGTRPVVVTAQHRELLDAVLALASLRPDLDLDLMLPDQSLDGLASRILTRFGAALDELRPNRVLVHGDTLTTMMASLACYFRRIPVGHVEAGLRSGDIYSPWPEEVNRKVTGVVADLHFAPTQTAADALRAENVGELTGARHRDLAGTVRGTADHSGNCPPPREFRRRDGRNSQGIASTCRAR